MAHPPRNYDDFEATGGEDGPVEEERIPNELNDLGRNLIHFDLDPGNSQFSYPCRLAHPRSMCSVGEVLTWSLVLVGDFNVGDKHGMTPILKVRHQEPKKSCRGHLSLMQLCPNR